jgi:hypothetical protein
VRCAVRRGFSGEKGLWSVAEEALLPRSAFGGAGVNGSGAVFVCGGSPWRTVSSSITIENHTKLRGNSKMLLVCIS